MASGEAAQDAEDDEEEQAEPAFMVEGSEDESDSGDGVSIWEEFEGAGQPYGSPEEAAEHSARWEDMDEGFTELDKWLMDFGLLKAKLPKAHLTELIRKLNELVPDVLTFKSADQMNERLDGKLRELDFKVWDIMPDAFDPPLKAHERKLIEQLKPVLYYRDPIALASIVFSDPAFSDHIALRPVKLWKGKRETENRVYADYETARYWWKLQTPLNKILKLGREDLAEHCGLLSDLAAGAFEMCMSMAFLKRGEKCKLRWSDFVEAGKDVRHWPIKKELEELMNTYLENLEDKGELEALKPERRKTYAGKLMLLLALGDIFYFCEEWFELPDGPIDKFDLGLGSERAAAFFRSNGWKLSEVYADVEDFLTKWGYPPQKSGRPTASAVFLDLLYWEHLLCKFLRLDAAMGKDRRMITKQAKGTDGARSRKKAASGAAIAGEDAGTAEADGDDDDEMEEEGDE
ncbi:hypothetical protein DFJ74DRAFT_711476 [Hyaloraphidium curvatum]|nr:hypothetical protein DFJ74DRAFT_711476 [Hyaloraphidium curvatum]